MSRVARFAGVAAVLTAALLPARASAITPTCDPNAFSGEPNACGSVSCRIDDVEYKADCDDVQTESSGKATLKVLSIIVLFVLAWGLPIALLRRAADRRGLDKSELTGAWMLFGWAGVSYHLMKAIPRRDEAETGAQPRPKLTDADVLPALERAAANMSVRKQQRKSQ